MAQALVHYLKAQHIITNEKTKTVEPLFGCAFAIFGHGNVTCLGQQFYESQDKIPVWRGQNEQSMAHAAIAYSKAKKRRQIGIALSSIGPGSTNMVTAAGVAHTNRLPLLLLSGDSFQSRLPDPVLQQTEHFYNPSITVSDCFHAVTRYWDRITTPSQLLQSLPQAISILLDPAECGPVYLGLPQDIQGTLYDFPKAFFQEKTHRIRRPQPESIDIENACSALLTAEKPVIIAGGGVHYSLACETLQQFAEQYHIPVVETIAGRACLLGDHALNCGPIGVTGSQSAKAITEAADCVLAIGTRLQDFTTGSWTTFRNPNMTLITINTARADAIKHNAIAIQADAKIALQQLSHALEHYTTPQSWHTSWHTFAASSRSAWHQIVANRVEMTATNTPSYAQVIGQVNQLIDPHDRIITAAGGLPAELNMNWISQSRGQVDIEFGFSCMGYEISGGWGAKMACPNQDVIVMVGDGSYLMMNSDIYSSILTGHKCIIIICDNGGFAVIDKLQHNTGNTQFNNLFEHCNTQRKSIPIPRVDFVQHAQSMGAYAEKVTHLNGFATAFQRAKSQEHTSVLVIDIHPNVWSEVDLWWEVGLPDASDAQQQWNKDRHHQRRGV